jgi:hypothetical protein
LERGSTKTTTIGVSVHYLDTGLEDPAIELAGLLLSAGNGASIDNVMLALARELVGERRAAELEHEQVRSVA